MGDFLELDAGPGGDRLRVVRRELRRDVRREDLGVGAGDDLVALQPECARERLVDVLIVAGPVLDEHRRGTVVHEGLQPRLARLEPLHRQPPLGQVAGHLGESDQLARLVSHRRDDHVGPEERAILSYAPPLVFESTLGGRLLELDLGPASLDLPERIEAREVVAQDLVLPVTLDAFRARVPADDASFGVEHEDRVVDDAFHQRPEMLLALREPRVASPCDRALRFSGLASFCHSSICGVCSRATSGIIPIRVLSGQPSVLPNAMP